MRHKHRILPGHVGGTYVESNVVSVSVTQHAMWHFANWQLWGREEDRLAWKGLSGAVGLEDLVQESIKIGARKGGKASGKSNGKANIAKMPKETLAANGKTNIAKMSKEVLVANGKTNGAAYAGTLNNHPNTIENRRVQGKANGKVNGKVTGPANGKANGPINGKVSTSQKWQCLVTGYISNPGGLSAYQKARGIDTTLRVRV